MSTENPRVNHFDKVGIQATWWDNANNSYNAFKVTGPQQWRLGEAKPS